MFVKSKWQSVGRWSWGACGSSRLHQLIARDPRVLVGDDPYSIADRIRDLVKEDGYQSYEDKGGPLYWSDESLLARRGAIWKLCSDYTVLPIPVGTLAVVGSGLSYALGADQAMLLQSKPPKGRKRVLRSVEVAMSLDYYSGGDLWSRTL